MGKAIDIAAIEAKQVFNEEEMTIDYSKKRATDCKHNTCVKLPGPRPTKKEEGIEYRRMVWKRIYRDFKDQFSGEKGVQESNLTLRSSRREWRTVPLSLSKLTNMGSSAS